MTMFNKIVLFLLSLSLPLGAQTAVKTYQGDDLAKAKLLFDKGEYLAAEKLIKENDLESGFYLNACRFELREESAKEKLYEFLEKYPVQAYKNECNLMIAILEYEDGNSPKSTSLLKQINSDNFAANDLLRFHYYRGLSYLAENKTEEAIREFDKIRGQNWKMRDETDYYYAYSNYAAGIFDQALPVFESFKDNPKFTAFIPYYLLQMRYQQGDLSIGEEALQVLQSQSENPLNYTLYKILGELEYSKGNFENSLNYFSQYEKLATNPHRNVLFTMAMAYYDLKKFPFSIQYLKRVTGSSDKLSQKAYLFMGNSYLKVNDKENARMAYEAALELHFDSQVREQALYNYALTSYESTSAFGEAISGFEQFLNEYPNSVYANDAQNYLATELLSSKNYEKAFESVEKIKSPNNSILETRQYLLYQMGANAFQANQYEKARDLFSYAIQTLKGGSYEAESYYWRSECFSRLSQNSKSISDLHAYFAIVKSKESSNFVKAHYSMAYAYFSQKAYASAEEWFGKFIEKFDQKRTTVYADALNRLADCYYAQRNFKKAELTYLDALNASPNTGDYGLFQSAYVTGILKNYATKISRLSRLVTNYPKSEYVDEALYEMGRSYLMLKNEKDAIRVYNELISRQPNSALSRKAAVEIGMSYDNQGNNAEAIAAFKKVIADYPGTDEAYTSLENLENIYIESNEVKSFLDYTKTLNLSMSGKIENREDSINFMAAEKQYFSSNYDAAIRGFHNYLQKYCAGGRYCTFSLFYLADSYDKLKDNTSALQMYKELLKIQGNQYMEGASKRAAEISFELKDYFAASEYFNVLYQYAQSSESKLNAQLGCIRADFALKNYDSVVVLTSNALTAPKISEELITEIRFLRAKSYLATSKPEKAVEDLRFLSENTRTEVGAESKYLLAKALFDMKDLTQSEKEIMDFAKKNTPYPYWLARSFVLIADIYFELDNPFQAKQFLLSLKKNYKTQDDIQGMIEARLTRN